MKQTIYSVSNLATEVAEIWGNMAASRIRRSLTAPDTYEQELHQREAVRCATEAAHHGIRAMLFRECGR
jgi:hypothetical protein